MALLYYFHFLRKQISTRGKQWFCSTFFIYRENRFLADASSGFVLLFSFIEKTDFYLEQAVVLLYYVHL